MMWWPMLNPLPEYQTLSDIKKLGYMFANGILLTPACALIILRQPVIYNVYGSGCLDESDGTMCTSGHFIRFKYNGTRILHWMPVVQDQQTGGIIMKIVQEIVYGTIIGYVFFRWARREREKDKSSCNNCRRIYRLSKKCMGFHALFLLVLATLKD